MKDIREQDEESSHGDEEESKRSIEEELALIQKQVGQLTELVEGKDQEIDELRGNIRSEKSTFVALHKKLKQVEEQLNSPQYAERFRRAETKPLMEQSTLDELQEDLKEDIDDKEEKFEDDKIIDDDEETVELAMIGFDEDTFSLMMTNPVRSRDWFLAIQAVSFQWILLTLIFINLIDNQKSPLNIPYSVPIAVTAGQFLGIFICVGVQTDVLSSVRLVAAMWYEENWAEVLGVEKDNATRMTFFVRIMVPNGMKFISGCMVLSVNFVTIVQSDNIVDLMKDVAALLIISEITEIFFKLAEFGFLGQMLEDHAKIVPETEVQDPFGGKSGKFQINTRLLVFCVLVAAMSTAVGLFIVGQQNGDFFKGMYPYCKIAKEDIPKFGNGRCDGGILNSIACDFDGGDCVNYNLAYPNCGAAAPWKIGDDECNQAYNTPECDYDGADCCPFIFIDDLGVETKNARLKDGMCDGGQFSSQKCEFDEGDCTQFQVENPNCDLNELANNFVGSDVPRLGDGICESAIYNTPDCNYENGDCIACNNNVYNLTLTGNGICHGGFHNTEECNFDAGDCAAFNVAYPRCQVDTRNSITLKMRAVPIIGDGICNSGLYNNPDCGFEDGDCLLCNELITNVSKIGDGFCDGQDYMSQACGFDGGDCLSCDAPRYEIANSWCTPEYNNEACSWDGGDCDIINSYPNCTVPLPSLLGNGYCNGGVYNTDACGFDHGDCIEAMNLTVNSCNVPRIELLGDGVCQGGTYNTAACEFDKGDCLDFNKEYPDCDVTFPELVGNGWCSGGEYDTEACGYDGGDCVDSLPTWNPHPHSIQALQNFG